MAFSSFVPSLCLSLLWVPLPPLSLVTAELISITWSWRTDGVVVLATFSHILVDALCIDQSAGSLSNPMGLEEDTAMSPVEHHLIVRIVTLCL